jgi:hypothetical protein
LVTAITVDFSGALDALEAESTGIYRLTVASKKGSFAGEGTRVIALRSAVYNSNSWVVTIAPRKPFALTKPVELVVNGESPSGLQDAEGRLIDGADNGMAGGNFVAVISSRGVS